MHQNVSRNANERQRNGRKGIRQSIAFRLVGCADSGPTKPPLFRQTVDVKEMAHLDALTCSVSASDARGQQITRGVLRHGRIELLYVSKN